MSSAPLIPPKTKNKGPWGLVTLVILILGIAGGIVYQQMGLPKLTEAITGQPEQTRHGGQGGNATGENRDKMVPKDTPPTAGGAAAPTPVGTSVASKGDIRITRRALGTVTPFINVTVHTQITGQLMELGFKEGQIVQKGDFLAQIDPRPYQNAMEQATGNLQRDQALLKDATATLDRYKTLIKKDAVSQQQVDTQESLMHQYEGAVLADQSQIDTAKLNLTYCHITAPISGRVGLKQVDPGNYVQPGDANGIVVLTQVQPISILFTLPEDDIPLVSKAYDSGKELQVDAYDRTFSTKLATGKLVALDNQVNTSTGTFKLNSNFDNNDNSLFPNQFVNVELLVDTLHDQIVIPTAAVQRGVNGAFVYLVKDDKTVAVRPIKTGQSDGDKVAVTEGISVGDKVVTEGIDKLRDGAAISIP